MNDAYFQRVHAQSPTRLWINNPTASETKAAIESGAVACTTNPTHTAKMYSHPEEHDIVERDIDTAIARYPSDADAAASVQREAVARLAGPFMDVYKKSNGKLGWVSIQISPFREDNPAAIVKDAHENRKISPNIIAKIPATKVGLEAIGELLAENIPVIATEIMGISQAIAACELYKKVSAKHKIDAAYYVTHISGIFDDYLKSVAPAGFSTDLLFQAGLAVARKQYRIMKERDYPGILLGGGARGLHHFTEMVGGDLHVTINWKGGAGDLIQQDPPVVWRMDNPVPDYVIKGLEEIPDFRRAYAEDGLKPEEFADFGPVVLFRTMFTDGWKKLESAVKERRLKIGK
ncbi:MAG: transaldolase family protein [Treponemataceae bacterium]